MRTPALLIALACLTSASVARAEPLPFEATAEVGDPAREVRVRAETSEDGLTITATIGRRDATETVRVDGLSEATLERVEVAPGHALALLRATSGEGREVNAIIGARRGRPEILWTGRMDMHGDPGERMADVLSREDRTGDGRPDLLVGVRREGVDVCGAETILMGRAYDPASSRMRPVVLRRVGAGDETAVVATRDSPGPEGPPLLRSFEARGASSTSGHREEDRTGLTPPRALVDGRADTFWAEGRGGPGAQEFVVLRWNARYPIHALAIIGAPEGEAARALGRPRTFWLVGDEGQRLRVTMPDDAGLHAGERYWIVPPEPLEWRCVAVVLDEAYAPAGRRADAVHTGFAELEIYTELDFGAGVDDLVNVLVRGGRQGDEATRLLSSLGAPAVTSLYAAWERLDALGRRRAVRVFTRAARREIEGAIEGLARATHDETREVRVQAMEALGTLGAPATPVLAELVREPPPIGDEAVDPLLRHPPVQVVPALIAAIETEGGSERPRLREGLASALVADARDDAGEGRVAFAAWAGDEPPVGAFASAALGIASRSAVRHLVEPVLAAMLPRAERFEDRWRLVRAARELSPDPAVDAWLAERAAEAEEWMIRGAAVEALGNRGSPEREEVARAALSDRYPRVRVEAVRVLDALDAADDLLAARARRDRWPMVRAAAVEALFRRPAGVDAIRRSVRDRAAIVRRAAIATLTRAGDGEAWPLVRARLQDDDEWPRVTVAALRYVRQLCLTEAGEDVLEVLRRGIRPDAWAPDVDVAAVAMDVALRLGGATRQDASRIAAREDTPASIRAAARRRGGGPPPTCRPR